MQAKGSAAMELDEGTCSTCGAPIAWVVMRGTGKRMPLDADFAKNVIVLNQKGEGMLAKRAYTSHFATCKDADKHRRKR